MAPPAHSFDNGRSTAFSSSGRSGLSMMDACKEVQKFQADLEAGLIDEEEDDEEEVVEGSTLAREITTVSVSQGSQRSSQVTFALPEGARDKLLETEVGMEVEVEDEMKPEQRPKPTYSTLPPIKPRARKRGRKKKIIPLLDEAKQLCRIAVPTVAVQLCVFLVFMETASSIGRYLSNEELAAFSLASLTGNLTCLSVILGVLTAAETLLPIAFGHRDYKEVGRIAVRGYLAGLLVLLPPILPLLTVMDKILLLLQQHPKPSLLASQWIRVYLLGVPFVLFFRVLQRFLTCQRSVMPLVYAGGIGTLIVHPILLRILIPLMGFIGSGVAVSITQAVTVLIALVIVRWKKPHHPETWPGLKVLLPGAVKIKYMVQFLRLGIGGVLSLSEWWFWECVCFTAGRFGVIPLCVHTIAYQLIPFTFMVPLGIGIGLTVQVGSIITRDVPRVRRLCIWTFGFTVCLASLVALAVFMLRDFIVSLFTNDEDVKAGCARIWSRVSLYIFFLYVYGINGGIMNALGLQTTKATIIVSCLWCCGLPLIWYVAVKRGGGLDAIWNVLPFLYAAMNVALMISYIRMDWQQISNKMRRQTRRRSSIIFGVMAETTPLISNNDDDEVDKITVDHVMAQIDRPEERPKETPNTAKNVADAA